MPTHSNGVILLSFDDHFTAGWVNAIPLFAQYGARVTFFVDHLHELSSRQLDDLHRLAALDHDIACHGLTHAHVTDVVKKRGAERLLAKEIDPGIDSMRSHGFEPRSFAYPRSRRTGETDALLSRRFAHLRAGLTTSASAPVQSMYGCLMPDAECAMRRLARHPVNVAMDCVAGPDLGSYLETVAAGCHWVVIATLGGSASDIDMNSFFRRGIKLIGSTLRSRTTQMKADMLADLERRYWPAFSSGQIQLLIHQTLPITQAEQAHAILERNGNLGKVVLTIDR